LVKEDAVFTGLVEELGTIVKLTRRGLDAELEVSCTYREIGRAHV
jgi:hypothetical protein